MSIRLLISLAVPLAVVVAACGDRTDEARSVDTTIVPLPMQGERTREFNPANVENFERVVREQYSREALALPRREMDSILAANRNSDPAAIQTAMEKRLKEQDATARENIARRYGISIDSLNAILSRK